MLHEAVQEASSPIYGPLWVSVGDAFSPTGTIHFIKYLRRTIKGQLKDAVKYKNEVISLSFSLSLCMRDIIFNQKIDVLMMKLLIFSTGELCFVRWERQSDHYWYPKYAWGWALLNSGDGKSYRNHYKYQAHVNLYSC